nr:reverse transcriptase domain-containing protein [Tanacetum cinerariifolium]
MKMNTALSLGSRTLLGNTITNLKEELKGITTRSRTAYQGPTIPTTSSSLPPVVERETEATKDTVHPTNNGSTKDVQPLVVQTESPTLNSEPIIAPIIEPVAAPVSASKPNQKLSIPYHQDCMIRRMAECLALADLGASINLMPLSVWNKLSLLKLTLTLMTLELADRSISRPISVAEDVYVKVGKFHFPAITFNLDKTLRYSANYNDITANRIDVIDMACEEYSQEVFGFSDMIASGDNKFPVIIVKALSIEEKTALITVLKLHKRAIAWKLSDIKGIDPEFCTHKILMDNDFEPAVQHQRRVNLQIQNVIKNEVLKLDTGLIYPISDSPWISTDHSALKYLFAKKDSKAILLRWVLLLQEFTFKVIDTKGAENLASDHLS